jgi:hypothetical protein
MYFRVKTMLHTDLGWGGLTSGWRYRKVDITEWKAALEPGIDRIVGNVMRSVLRAR